MLSKEHIYSKLLDFFLMKGIYIENEACDLELDSITYLDILISLENFFGIQLPPEKLIDAPKTFNDYLEIIFSLYSL